MGYCVIHWLIYIHTTQYSEFPHIYSTLHIHTLPFTYTPTLHTHLPFKHTLPFIHTALYTLSTLHTLPTQCTHSLPYTHTLPFIHKPHFTHTLPFIHSLLFTQSLPFIHTLPLHIPYYSHNPYPSYTRTLTATTPPPPLLLYLLLTPKLLKLSSSLNSRSNLKNQRNEIRILTPRCNLQSQSY